MGAPTLTAARAEYLTQQGGLSHDDRFELARAYALADRPTQAMALLTGLDREGYFKDAAARERLRSEEDLKSLRSRRDFQELLAAPQPAGR
jgi:hypothetical protein